MVMKASVTINLRLPVELFDWLEAEAASVAISPTTAARVMLAKARTEGMTLK